MGMSTRKRECRAMCLHCGGVEVSAHLQSRSCLQNATAGFTVTFFQQSRQIRMAVVRLVWVRAFPVVAWWGRIDSFWFEVGLVPPENCRKHSRKRFQAFKYGSHRTAAGKRRTMADFARSRAVANGVQHCAQWRRRTACRTKQSAPASKVF